MDDVFNGLLLLGFGGHARSVFDVASRGGIREFLFVDENAKPQERFLGFEVRREFDGLLPSRWRCAPAAGHNSNRKMQAEEARARGWPIATIVSQTATIGKGAQIGEGCFVGHHVHIGPLAQIDTGTILNTGCVVEHDCRVGAFAHISVNATMAGRSRIGDLSFLGAGAVVIDDCEIGSRITIGAGAVVVKSITAPGVYVGSPARFVKGC